MKTLAILTGILMFIVGTCEGHDQMGYPKKVTFPKTGGEQTIHGNVLISDVYFMPSNDGAKVEYVYLDEDHTREMEIITKDWLTVKYECNSNEITLVAQPLESGKKRKFHLQASVIYKYADITVEQQ